MKRRAIVTVTGIFAAIAGLSVHCYADDSAYTIPGQLVDVCKVQIVTSLSPKIRSSPDHIYKYITAGDKLSFGEKSVLINKEFNTEVVITDNPGEGKINYFVSLLNHCEDKMVKVSGEHLEGEKNTVYFKLAPTVAK